MSATRMRTVLLLALAQVASVCASQWCSAAPAAGSTAATARRQSSAQHPLTRNDVELLLREARSAIEQGRLEEAETLLKRADNAHVHYSLFHFGPTPASVRRELTRAQRTSRGHRNVSNQDAEAGKNRLNPFSSKRSEPASSNDSSPSTGTTDPFMSRGRAGGESQALPSAPNSQPVPPSISDREFGDAAAIASQPSQNLPTLRPTANNPFAPVTPNAIAPARYETGARSADELAPAAWDGGAAKSGLPTAARPAPAPSGTSRYDASWALPDAPLPSGVKNQSVAANSEFGLAPPRRSPRGRSASDAASSGNQPKQQALIQLTQARQALDGGDIELAEKLSREASALGVPESEFLPNEDRPSLLAWDIVRARQNQAGSQGATTRLPVVGTPATQPAYPMATPRLAAAEQSPTAEELPAPNSETPLDEPAPSAPAATSLIDAADESQQVLARQLSAEIGKRQSEAQKLRSEDPERALAILREAQRLVNDSKLPESSRRELLSRIDITLEKTEKYIKQHGAEIELDQRNEAVLAERDRDRAVKLRVKQKIAELVEEFNRLRDEQRYAEAEIVARRLIELAPDDPVAQQVYQTAKFIRREMMNRDLVNRREEGNWDALNDVEESSVSNVGDGRELVFNQTHWDQFVKNRKGTKDRVQRRTERELEIERRLKTPVMLRYEDTPLSEVVDGLSQLTGVNIHLDPRGLEQEGYNNSTPVSINLHKEISLQSALNLILEPLHLSYVVKDDVLKITSEQLRDGEIYPITYNVSDLVIPIPNFVPSNNIGLQGLINDAHAAAGYGHSLGDSGPAVLVNGRQQPQGAATTDQVLAQQFNASPANGLSPSTVPIGAGPGGMGGAANADFDSLIDLIVSTVQTETWAENGGGEAEIRPFPTNLSLVISQTQAVHEEIADLLEQLRRLQDLQVTIEVRFIRLNDRFFERIGVSFTMDIVDQQLVAATPVTGGVTIPGIPGVQSATVGLQQPGPPSPLFPNFTADLDIPFRQGSFNLAVPPPFAGFDPNSAASFGFAILSDIEAFFLIEAAQGDARTNILNAPKVTLFNGQQAFVADATQRPFVVGVIPVVGEFAAAQQPVIVVLNEGTMMTIQAVVSDDRRYVRMTIVPFFTQIGDVDEFTFEGTSSSTSSSSATDSNTDGKNESKAESDAEVRTGVTVQLPSFSFVSVVTTVSVPDGGTVLLGGIKRLSEGRSEFGVPLLSKVPYINRLFRNVGIGRQTDSLMMMVTPRIIIQEEEEERLGVAVP